VPRSLDARRLAAIGLLLVVALSLRLGYVALTPGYRIVHDARDYDAHARSIAAGDGFARLGPGPSRATAFRPPAYPVLLAGVYALTGHERRDDAARVTAGRVANALVGTAIVALVGLLAAQLLGRRVALVAMALGAVYLPLILVGGSLMSEPLFAALMLAALAAAIAHRRSEHRLRWAAVAGVLGGLAILTRANGLILLAPLAFAVWDARPRWSPRALAAPALLVGVAVLTVAPWTVRNAEVLGAFVPVTTQLGTSLAGTYNDVSRDDRRNPASWRSLRRVPQYQYLTAPGPWRRIGEAELERKLRAVAVSYAERHPTYVAAVALRNTQRALDLAGLTWARHTYGTVSVGPGWANAAVVMFWLVGALALAGAFTAAGRGVPTFVVVAPVLLYISVVFLAFETPRYRTAIDPFIAILAAAALVTAGEALRRRRSARA
jgi:4-amino-4-deoxy-L-arabinose transferase-like glycosyltransferase